MNSVILVGRLTKDPEVKYVGEKNILVTNFTLAVDRKSKKESKGQSSHFICCSFYHNNFFYFLKIYCICAKIIHFQFLNWKFCKIIEGNKH